MSYIHAAPLAAAMLKRGTVYTTKRHSLWLKPLMSSKKVVGTSNSARTRESAMKPTNERGRDDKSSFGREEVKYVWKGETW